MTRTAWIRLGFVPILICLLTPAWAAARTVTADVVILDHVLVYNRLGAQNVNGMIYALKRDVVDSNEVPLTSGGSATPGQVTLRPDKRPRPLVLRVNVGDTLVVNFTNLLTPSWNPFPPLPEEANPCNGCDADNPLKKLDNQVASRWAGFHVHGLELANSIDDDASWVGANNNSLASHSGGTRTYSYLAKAEGTFLVTSYGATFGGEASGGNVGVGAFAVVNVQPKGSRVYRSQVTEEELRLARTGLTADGHPVLPFGVANIGYEAKYPNVEPWISEGKAKLPILNMLDDSNNIVHADINAIVAGTNADGSFDPGTYPLESKGVRNPTVPNRLEPFREFTIVFHDETAAANAFPAWFRDDINPVLSHTTHGVRDSFMINYGSGGIGSEIIANRLGVGPMWDCLDCAYEEFFLTAFAVGDPAMLVDVPANTGLENCGAKEGDPNCADLGPKATRAFYPDDPSNVHHSYTGDFVKFRNLHAGPKEQHIFHLHNHQWLFNANDDNSNYIDAQSVGPGSGYTYEINFGGSGNRNKTAGDAIFHCHFYPHFAQGMWEMWRVHDTTEVGTRLAVSGNGIHTEKFGLKDGTPAVGARALPDGEILDGTPIPAVVPLPGKPMAPMPGRVTLVAKDANGDGWLDSSQADVDRTDVYTSGPLAGQLKNPGFPFWIAGVDCGGPGKVNPATGQCDDGIVGQRPTTPPLDMLTKTDAEVLAEQGDPLFSHPGLGASAGGFDGGLPRHALDGCLAAENIDPLTGQPIPCREDVNVVEQHQTRFDFRKEVHRAKPVYYPEEGTDVEQAAMRFHSVLNHPTWLGGTNPPVSASYRTNGALPVGGAPFAEPCVDDEGDLFTGPGQFFGATAGSYFTGSPQFGATNPRVYKAANIQIDAIFNKVGYHFPQQRIISLWQDVLDFHDQTKPPEPFVIRMNTFDCTQYYHSNLVPKEYQLDDYQVRTPTDVIGQHIHLPKWDLVSADGSANGWNYEDGTLSPEMVIERIVAINKYNETAAQPIPTLKKPDGTGGGLTTLTPALNPDPVFPASHPEAVGARTTLQRWFADPVVNIDLEDRGLGVIFTHDHFGPSTHQQVGLYATVLTEPAGSTWRHNETGVQMATRPDGGPTSWQAVISDFPAGGDGQPADSQPFREFYFEFADFQHAYEKGAEGILSKPDQVHITSPDSQAFRHAINPPVRQEVGQGNVPGDEFPDILRFPEKCPGGVPRPCPEAISVDDIGMLVVNYRNEPVGLRVYDPDKLGPDLKPGTQADGKAGDLAFALQTRTDRAIPEMNKRPADLAFWGSTLNNPNAVLPGDPFTPMMRTRFGDLVKVKIQAGGHEHEHNASIHGLKWLQGGSGHGEAPNSGWRNSQNVGISEQFTFSSPIFEDVAFRNRRMDLAYTMDASQDGWWSGVWGLLRAYNQNRTDLVKLENEYRDADSISLVNRTDFAGFCPSDKDLSATHFNLTAVLANEVLDNSVGATLIPTDSSVDMHVGGDLDPDGGTLVYNARGGVGQSQEAQFDGPLHDPTAILYVYTSDLEPQNSWDPRCVSWGGAGSPIPYDCPARLKDSAPREPLVLRAAAGECVKVTLHNKLPKEVPDLAGYNTLLQVVIRDHNDSDGGVTTFNNNLIRPSSYVGIHPQMVEFDSSRDNGILVGTNPETGQLVEPGDSKTYRWYMGHFEPNGFSVTATPVEFGGSNLLPADVIKQGQKGMVGALVVEPEGSTWTHDKGSRASATVSTGRARFRDFAVVFQKALNLRYGDARAVPNIAGEGATTVGGIDVQVPEDSHDAGGAAINYGTEPAWFRFGLPANAQFGNGSGELGAVSNAHRFYSNALAGGDPETPVFTALAGAPFRMRVLMPTGVGRGTTFNLHGHVWQRDPYLEGTVPSQKIGTNPLGFYMGGQESVTPSAHFDVVLPKAGGQRSILGDYLFRDHGSFGNTNGLWGLLRVDSQLPEQDEAEQGGAEGAEQFPASP